MIAESIRLGAKPRAKPKSKGAIKDTIIMSKHLKKTVKWLKTTTIYFSVWLFGTLCLYYFFLKPVKSVNSEDIRVCVIQGNVVDTLPFNELHNTDTAYTLCNKDIKGFDRSKSKSNDNIYSLDLTQIHQNSQFIEWEMIEMTDGLGDPIVDRYRVNNISDKVTSLWHEKGQYFAQFLSMLLSFFIIIFTKTTFNFIKDVDKQFKKRRNKKKHS